MFELWVSPDTDCTGCGMTLAHYTTLVYDEKPLNFL